MFDILKLFLFLLNEKIIITGTSRGIGYELALKFANAGHQVLAISRKHLGF
jgi:NAD(P)-dependent dehydrogenase (short-subunit alcohol dehydrogenase family)